MRARCTVLYGNLSMLTRGRIASTSSRLARGLRPRSACWPRPRRHRGAAFPRHHTRAAPPPASPTSSASPEPTAPRLARIGGLAAQASLPVTITAPAAPKDATTVVPCSAANAPSGGYGFLRCSQFAAHQRGQLVTVRLDEVRPARRGPGAAARRSNRGRPEHPRRARWRSSAAYNSGGTPGGRLPERVTRLTLPIRLR